MSDMLQCIFKAFFQISYRNDINPMIRVAKKQPLSTHLDHLALCTKIIYKRFCYAAMQCENGSCDLRLVAEAVNILTCFLFLVALEQIRESNIITESMTNKTVRLIVLRLDFRTFQ